MWRRAGAAYLKADLPDLNVFPKPSEYRGEMHTPTVVNFAAVSTIYYLVERVGCTILRRMHPPFYRSLKANHKLPVFTGIAMGLLITLISTPYCVNAALFPHSSTAPIDSQFCFTLRTLLWVSELNRLDLYILYVVHHVGALSSLWMVINFHWPVQCMHIIIASLVSEIPGDLSWLLAAYMEHSDRESATQLRPFRRMLAQFNIIQYVILRFCGIGAAGWFLWHDEFQRSAPMWQKLAAWSSMAAHAIFCIAYIRRQWRSLYPLNSATLPVVQVFLEHKPAHAVVRILNLRIIFSIYGPLMGFALTAIGLSVKVFAPQSCTPDTILMVIVSAVFGARLLSMLMEDRALVFRSPLRAFLRPGFWLQGGIIGAGASAVFARKMGMINDLPSFIGAMAIGLPLYEFFSRVGCHYYGCCFGKAVPNSLQSPWWAVRYAHPSLSAVARSCPRLINVPLYPAQLMTAVLCLSLFVSLACLHRYSLTPLFLGSISLVVHGLVRIYTETFRADNRGGDSTHSGLFSSVTAKIAAVQILGGSVAAMVSFTRDLHYIETREPILPLIGSHWVEFFTFCFGTVVYGTAVDNLGEWVPQTPKLGTKKL